MIKIGGSKGALKFVSFDISANVPDIEVSWFVRMEHGVRRHFDWNQKQVQIKLVSDENWLPA